MRRGVDGRGQRRLEPEGEEVAEEGGGVAGVGKR